jgi:hypothetical protein
LSSGEEKSVCFDVTQFFGKPWYSFKYV